MASGYRAPSISTSSYFKSSSSSVTSVSSIRSSLSASTSISTRTRTFSSRISTDPNTENALIKEIYEQFLLCKLCFKPFYRPKTLNCLHTFCEECLVRNRESELESSRYVSYSMRSRLVCPICTKKTELPPGGIRRLQDSFLLSSLNQVVTRVSRSSKSSTTGPCEEDTDTLTEDGSKDSGKVEKRLLCGICCKTNLDEQMSSSYTSTGSNTADCHNVSSRALRKNSKTSESSDIQEKPTGAAAATATTAVASASSGDSDSCKEATVECLDCSAKLLCKECAEMHMATEVTQNHSLVDISLARQGRLQCSDHSHEMVRFYCENCVKCVCVLCTFNDHKTHKIVTFSESIKAQLGVLESQFQHCKTTFETMREHLETITKFEAKVACAEELIREKSNQLMRMIKDKEEELLNELKVSLKNEDVANFLEQKPQMEEMLSSIETTFNVTENLLKNKNVEIILMKKHLEDRMKSLMEWTSKNVPATLTAPLVFIPHVMDVKFGVLKTKESDCENSGASSAEEFPAESLTSDNVERTSNSDNDSSFTSNTRESSLSSRQSKDTENDCTEAKVLVGQRKDHNVNRFADGGEKAKPEGDSFVVSERDKNERNRTGSNLELESKLAKPQLLVSTTDSSTNTDFIAWEDKSTITNQSNSQFVNKGVATISLVTADKGIGTTTTNVSSAYREFVDTKAPKLVAVSRGTMTSQVTSASSTSEQQSKCDRSSSPITILKLDKAVMANKAELIVPKEVFCRPGLEGKPKKIIDSIPASAKLDSINEGSDEDRSSSEETKIEPSPHPKLPQTSSPKFGNRSIPARPLPNFMNQRNPAPNSAIVHPLSSRRSGTALGEKFRPSFNAGSKLTPLKCLVEIGINTEIVSSQDKSTGTDSPPVFEKMAECINKLKTVRHRLECIQSPSSIGSENKDYTSAISKASDLSISISSSFETAVSDNDNASSIGHLKGSHEGGESPFSARDVKKYILSVDAGGGSTARFAGGCPKKKPKPYQPHSPGTLTKRQHTPTSSVTNQYAGGNDNGNSSGGGSTSNSPNVQRSGKISGSSKPPAENPISSKSPKLVRSKPRSQQDTSETKFRQITSRVAPKNKMVSVLAELSDSLHSESSEEHDRCGSGESFAGMPAGSAAEGDRSFGASIKQRLTNSPLTARRPKSEAVPLIKSLNSRHKSPRPQKKI